MIIKTVELENFKSHLNTRVDFETGISIIMGDNGAGKSSILESISFALFKEYASKKMDKLINNDKNQMQVTVLFIANGRTYKVVRKRKRNSSPESMLYVKDNGRFLVIEKGDAAVSEEIERIIDLDKNLFLNAVYVKQGEIANLVTKNPSEKKEMMGRLLGVDDLENSWKNMKFIIKDYNDREIHINGKLANFQSTEENLKSKQDKRDELNIILSKKDSELKKTEEKLNKLKTIKEFFDRKEIEYNNLKREIEHNQSIFIRLNKTRDELSRQIEEINIKESKIEEIKPEIGKIKILENLRDKIFNLKELKNEKEHTEKSLKKIELFKKFISENQESYDNFLKLEREINELTSSRKEFEGTNTLKITFDNNIKNIQSEIEELQKSISNRLRLYGEILEEEISSIDQLEKCLETKKQSIKDNFKQNQEQIEGFNSKISDLKGQNKEIMKAIEELENADDKCPVCESDLEESRRKELLNKYRGQIEKNNNDINSYKENLGIWNAEREFLDRKSQKLEKISIDVLKKESNDLEMKKSKIKEIKEQLTGIKKSAINLREIDSKLEEKRALKDELKEGYNKYLGALNSLKAMEEPEELLVSFNKLKSTIEPLEVEINNLCDEVDVENVQVNTELERLRTIKETYDKLSGEVSVKDEILKSLSNNEGEIENISREIESKGEMMDQVVYESEKHHQAINDLNSCQKEFEELEKEFEGLKGELKGIIERISELKNEVESFKKDKEELTKISRFIELLNEIRKLYGKDGLQKDLRNISRPLIENNTLDFFNKFNFEYSDIKLNEDYDVTLFGPSGENTLDMISGGEIIAVAIALRLGIAKTLVKGNLELMILDEPTVHLDSYRRHELIDVIKKLSVIPQMIIVTHDAGLEEAATNILKIEKKNGVSQIASI